MIDVSEADLSLEEHLKLYQGYIKNINSDSDAYFRNEAFLSHALSVQDALISSHLAAVSEIVPRLANADAKHFMLHGVAQRLKIIWVSFRSIINIAPPSRTNPLITDEAAILSRDLNVIYINIRATIDNYAWCLMHEKGETAPKRNQVDLFNEKFMMGVASGAVYKKIELFEGWWKDLKEKRDPAAHRIPLWVPPQVLSPEQCEIYQRRYAQGVDALEALDLETSEQRFQELERLGTFLPFFCHKPDEQRIPIYPTVPADIAVLVKISRAICDALHT